MNLKFDPKGIYYFFLLVLGIIVAASLIRLVYVYRISFQAILPFIVLFVLAFILYRIFFIPICMRMGWYEKGERLLKKALKRINGTPAVATLLFHLIYFLFQQGKFKEAESVINDINLGDLPPDASVLVSLNRAAIYIVNEKYQKALDLLGKYRIDDFPASAGPAFLNNIAFSYYGLGINIDEGIEMTDRAFGLKPDPRFAVTMAGLLFKKYELKAGLAWTDYALKRLKRGNIYTRGYAGYLRAQILTSMGDVDGALLSAKKARSICVSDNLNKNLDKLIQSLKSKK